MSAIIKVQIADYKITNAPDILVSYGLGSCVGLSLYEEEIKMAGLAHIMLPIGNSIRNERSKGKYADTAIRMMLAELEENGCNKDNIVAKLAGGASMFSNITKDDQKGIGERNVDAIKKYLEELEIPLKAIDTGGDYGRSIEFHTQTGEMKIFSVKHEIKFI